MTSQLKKQIQLFGEMVNFCHKHSIFHMGMEMKTDDNTLILEKLQKMYGKTRVILIDGMIHFYDHEEDDTSE